MAVDPSIPLPHHLISALSLSFIHLLSSSLLIFYISASPAPVAHYPTASYRPRLPLPIMLDVDGLEDDLVSRAIVRVAKQTRNLVPWTALPFATASVAVADVLQNLTSHTVHDVYFPFVRFSVLHAARVAIAWAAMTRGRKPVGLFADLFGFLVIACERGAGHL